MTVAATTTFELSVDQTVRRAFQLAGLLEASQSPSEPDAALGRDFLNLELDALESEGILTRTIDRVTQALSIGVDTYTLGADVVGVFVGPDQIAGTIVNSTNAETYVRAISRHEYVEITAKTATGTPTLVYPECLASTKLIFWPIPDAAVTFRYQARRLPRDSTAGTTSDIDRRRQKAVLWSLAHDVAVAKSVPIDRVKYLKNEAERLKMIARGLDTQPGNIEFFVRRRRSY